jgi:phosphoglycolate phosphatase
MLPIDLIVFDFDGTLLETHKNIAWAVNQTLSHFGLKPRSEKQIAGFIGIGVDHLIKSSLGQKNQDLFEKAVRFFLETSRKNFLKKVRIYPGIKEVLDHFKDKHKVVITNKTYFITRLTLEAFHLSRHFEKVLGGDYPPLRKPGPAKIKMVLKEFSVRPERAIIVGDMDIDIQTGINAGIHTCAVTYGLCTKKELAEHNPEFLISSIRELKKIIV